MIPLLALMAVMLLMKKYTHIKNLSDTMTYTGGFCRFLLLSIAKNPYIFVLFQGRSGTVPSLDPPMDLADFVAAQTSMFVCLILFFTSHQQSFSYKGTGVFLG